jgi:hypothetical protein
MLQYWNMDRPRQPLPGADLSSGDAVNDGSVPLHDIQASICNHLRVQRCSVCEGVSPKSRR